AAVQGLRRGVLEYDRRHGYRGPEGLVKLGTEKDEIEEAVEEALAEKEIIGELVPAIVLEADSKQVIAHTKRGEVVKLTGESLKYVSRALADKASALKPVRGSIIRLGSDEKGG